MHMSAYLCVCGKYFVLCETLFRLLLLRQELWGRSCKPGLQVTFLKNNQATFFFQPVCHFAVQLIDEIQISFFIVRKEEGMSVNPTFNVSVVFGKRDEVIQPAYFFYLTLICYLIFQFSLILTECKTCSQCQWHVLVSWLNT